MKNGHEINGGRGPGGGGTVDYFEQFCANSKVPMVLIKENI